MRNFHSFELLNPVPRSAGLGLRQFEASPSFVDHDARLGVKGMGSLSFGTNRGHILLVSLCHARSPTVFRHCDQNGVSGRHVDHFRHVSLQKRVSLPLDALTAAFRGNFSTFPW